jgi:transcriptional regulator with XRE-family HTH domain
MSPKRDLATILREAREQRGISLRAAAADLGVAPSHLSRIENGEKGPSIEVQQKASDYYGLNPDQVTLAGGSAPDDIVRILQQNPGLLDTLRQLNDR